MKRSTCLLLTLAGAGLALWPACKGEGARRVNPVAAAHPNVYSALPSRSVVKRLIVQMAYNADDGRLYGRLRWPAPRDRADAFWRYQQGAWALHGVDARDSRGPEELKLAESRLTLAWTPTARPGGVPNFGFLGCAVACHDGASHMPDWTEDGARDRVSMHLPGHAFYANTGLDVWHWRAQTSNANGYWSDELLDGTQPGAGSALRLDPGSGGAGENLLSSGNPSFVYDPATTQGGRFAVPYAELAASPDYFFEDPAAPSPVSGLSTPKALDYPTAALRGYQPAEGDTVPYYLLSRRDGGRGDVLAALSHDGGATVAAHSSWNAVEQGWEVYLSRPLLTGFATSDVRLAEDGSMYLAFAVHSDRTAGRDHYVSLPQQVWLEDPDNPLGPPFGTDYTIRQIRGPGVVPDFTDTGFYGEWTIDLFLPGVLSLEFLTDTRSAAYLFGGPHGGAPSLLPALSGEVFIGCSDCHVVRADDPAGPFTVGGALELRTPRRGGLFEATPISLSAVVAPALSARCGACHVPGGIAGVLPLSGVPPAQLYANLVRGGHVRWSDPPASPLLKLPAENSDGKHPPTAAGLIGFADSDDHRRILSWILFNAPNN